MNQLSRPRCRFCGADLKEVFVDLGKTPPANSFLTYEQIEKEEFLPLCVYVCRECFLVQIQEFKNPLELFNEYAYFSSYSDSWLKHARNYVNMMIKRFDLNKNCKIIEIASNDGYLLQFFKKNEIPVLGIEPAKNVAEIAIKKGIPTEEKFFGTKTAEELVERGITADILIGNNVLAHVPKINDFVKGLKILLKPNGVITIEFPHLLQLIINNQFDTIYHEHFSYFSLIVVNKIFSHHGFVIFDVEEIPTHGGSLRIFAKNSGNEFYAINKNVKNLIDEEEKFGLTDISSYMKFSEKVVDIKKNLCNFLAKVKNERKKIVCYGAPAKGNTLLNYCNIGTEQIDYTVDRSPHKQGLYLPGTHIPIKDPEIIQKMKPDYLLILPWNLKDEIMSQMSFIREWGGKFVVPIPEVKVYS